MLDPIVAKQINVLRAKLTKLRQLEENGVVEEALPHQDYWRFYVRKPLELPMEFHDEYYRYGEVRW